MKKIFLSILIASNLYPCTGISIKSNENAYLQARTIEYGESNLNSKLIIVPKNHSFNSLLPNTKETGISWKSKYNFVGISVINERFIAEGLNETGLNAGFFYFPNYGSLEKYNKKYKSKSLVDLQLVSYILSNFKSVEEVKQNIKNLKIVNIAYDKDNNALPTAHFRVADSTGANIVIEIIENGKIMIYENKVGVITNSPDYPWHIKNLNNYVNLRAGNANNFNVNNQEISSFGAGTAALGLPGDITPPSRFVRAFFYLKTMPKLNTKDSIFTAFHILNNFDIPIGVEFSNEHKEYIPKDILSATQWSSLSDLSNLEFYYKTMNDFSIKRVDLKNINFKEYKIINLNEEKQINDIKI